jgi:hypothetical protein
MRFGSWASAGVAMVAAALLPAEARGADPAPPAAAPSTTAPADEPPPRPPLPPEPPRAPVPWAQHLEISTGLAVTELISTLDGASRPSPVRFRPGPGFFVDLGWKVFRYLRFSGFVVEANHSLQLPAGALGLQGPIQSGSVHTYTFGARLSPMLPIGQRVRLWLSAGAGWGRMEYPRMTAPELGSNPVRERSASIVEIPLGLGAAFEVIPRWLAIHAAFTGSVVPSQIGDALEPGQAIDAAGKMKAIGPLPKLDASCAQMIGLSLLL